MMKNSGNGKGSFGRSRSGRPARRRLSVGFNTTVGTVLIVAVVLSVLLGGPKTGAIVAGIGGLIWGGVALFRAQRRSFQQV